MAELSDGSKKIELYLNEIFGTGILSVEQTVTSLSPGGINEITVTLTSGEESKFYVRNGSGGGGSGLTEDVKTALLQLAQKVAYIDEDGTGYYQDLYSAFYPSRTLSYITCTFNQGANVIYDNASLNSLKQYLTVTAYYGDDTTEDVTASAVLSGTLEVGTSTITATYSGKTATFTVTVTAAPELTSIEAVFTQGAAVIYDTDSLDDLKQYLVVTATYDDSSTADVTDLVTLSGTLTAGTSTIVASYEGETDTFTVTVTAHTRDTTAEIESEGVVMGNNNTTYNKTYGGITIKYSMPAATTTLYPAGIIPYADNTIGTPGDAGSLQIYNNGTFVNYVNESGRYAQLASGTPTEYGSKSWTVGSYNQIAFSVDTRYLDDAYMYDKTTGTVWFAGINTPYYGMDNISEAEE